MELLRVDHVVTLECAASVADGHALPSEQHSETAPFKLESTVPSRLALGARCGYGQRCWGSPVRQKKKHTGNHSSSSWTCVFNALFRDGVSRVRAQVTGGFLSGSA